MSFATATTTLGQGEFSAPTDYPAGTLPRFVLSSDFNEDGALDLAVLSEDSVNVLLGWGDGSFQPPREFGAGPAAVAAAAADLNGDGAMDLAVANDTVDRPVAGTVSVLLGVGDGSFRPRQSFPVGVRPFGLVIGDLNGDGAADLAVLNLRDSTVSVLLGDGDGTFQPKQDFATAPDPESVTMADLNADGVLDLVIAAGTNTRTLGLVSVLLGVGDGTFLSRQDNDIAAGPRSVAAADLNGDGSEDLVTANWFSGTVSLLLGNGDGTFGPRQELPVGIQPASVKVGDLNGDGRPDLAVSRSNASGRPGAVSLLTGNGDGTFQPPRETLVGSQPLSLAIGDLNNDGALDIVTANFWPMGGVSVLLASSTETARTPALPSTEPDTISAAPTPDPVAVVRTLHEAWNAYDAMNVLDAFQVDAVVSTPWFAGPARNLAATAGTIDPFINASIEAHDYSSNEDVVTWTYETQRDTVRALGLEPSRGRGEAIVQGGKIRSYTLRADPTWQERFEAAQDEALRLVRPLSPTDATMPARFAVTLQLDDSWDLYTVNPDGSQLTRLTKSPEREIHPVWSPDGGAIAFSVGQPIGSGVRLGTNDLYVARSDGGDPRQVARGRVFGWIWSPDSALLAYSTGAGSDSLSARMLCSYDTVSLHIVDVSSGAEIAAVDEGRFPTWLGGGRELLFSKANQAQALEVRSGQLRSFAVPESWLPFTASPAGEWIIWVDSQTNELHQTDSRGEQALAIGLETLPGRTVIAEYAGCTRPRENIRAWTPDGSKVALLAVDSERARAAAPWDPLNTPLELLSIDVLQSGTPPSTTTSLPYERLLATFRGVLDVGARRDRTGRTEAGVRESDLGIASATWSGDGSSLFYAAAGRSPNAQDSLWRFFWYRPGDDSRGELLGSLHPWFKAYLACCGR